ncbi:diacylglycerol/lipid kinase family protein [Herbiconiux daphne]|uniref:Diacylglycerol kinase family protein n=1 Tax=Herbiconiux daphne TaxID=2970914 RepID=A0ABT2H5C6_9MICO|nr:diacylglycerol kinase family protein [Herbiconiux daphne]MCS5735134.1 diacylglycerol kinase family protein [Herbiconiux daphne]
MTEQLLATKTAAVVYNPIKVDIDALRSAVGAEQRAAGWGETLWFETSVDDVGQEVTRQALEAGADLVIAAGGDGTVRAVAEALRGSDATLALLPSGTGNLLARNLKLTLDDMAHSLNVAFTGDDRAIDLGVVDIEREDRSRDRHVFVVMAGMGIDAKMIKNTDDDLKAKAGWAAYVDAIVKSLRDPNELHLRFQLDGGPRKRATVHTLIVGNCGSLPANILLMPDAVVDDGRFDLLLMRPGSALGWVRVWFKVAWTNGVVRRTKAGKALAGERRNDGDLHYETGTRFVARLSRPEEIELDGDAFGEATAFNTWIEPGALTVRVPRSADGGTDSVSAADTSAPAVAEDAESRVN